MSALPDVEKTVQVLKSILSEGVDLASEKRRFQGFLQDYAGRARTEQGLKLERRHLNVLVLGMRYRRFDAVVKGTGDAAGLVGLGDWLARQEGYDKGLCQWVEVVWSKSLGLATDIELDVKRKSEEEKRRQADKRARRRNAEEQARRREAEVKRQEEAARERAEARRQAAVPGKVSRPMQSVEVFRDRLRGGGEGPAMVVLPTGSFRMGDLSGDGRRRHSERPVHTVTISRRIAMGQYPVTFEDYDRIGFLEAFLGNPWSTLGRKLHSSFDHRPSDQGWGRGRRPVIMVNWHDAKAYAVWLSKQTGKRYRLPSESEWEYAARAGTETRYSWGDEIGVNRANGPNEGPGGNNFGSKWSSRQTSPVGSFAPNGFGLYDMHGNVCEWVEDCWHDNYEGAPSDGSAWTIDSLVGEDKRVWRGGSYSRLRPNLRSAARGCLRSSGVDYCLGFRLVQDLNS